MHENYVVNVDCTLGTDNWTEFKSFRFGKTDYVLKFIKVEFDDGCDGDVEIKVSNNKGKLIPFATGGSDEGLTGVTNNMLKFYIGAGVKKNDEFTIEYKNRSSADDHSVNVFFEFVRKGGR